MTLPKHHDQFRWLAPTLLATAGLAFGLAVYVLDRPPGNAYLIPPSWSAYAVTRGLFGPGVGSLPSLLHSFGFAVLLGMALSRTDHGAALACMFWAAVDTAFEIGQHEAIAHWITSAIGDRLDGVPVLDHLNRYLTRGVFDPLDVAADLAGPLLAFAVLRFTFRREKTGREMNAEWRRP